MYVYICPVCVKRSLKNTPTKSSKKRSAGSNAGIINYLLYIVVHVPIEVKIYVHFTYPICECVQCIQLCTLNSSKLLQNCGEL